MLTGKMDGGRIQTQYQHTAQPNKAPVRLRHDTVSDYRVFSGFKEAPPYQRCEWGSTR